MPTEPVTMVVHGHFYQPPRENPWTEDVAREPSAAPYHDWNERIAAECYRPNAFARILDDRGRILAICNSYERLSFDVGPTLMSWLATNEPDAYPRIISAGRTGGAIAQAFSHLILPLATERDIRTQIRWGLADFRHRFGRPSRGMWLPEAAVNDTVLAILAEEGVEFTILAPGQAARIRPLGGAGRQWVEVTEASIDTRRPYRWRHPEDPDLGVDIVFYHGGLSHTLAFGLPGLSSQALVDRVVDAAGPEGGLVLLATDGETFGHHHHWGDRLLAYALAVAAPDRGIEVTDTAGFLDGHRPAWEVQVHESAWSCVHGVGRWARDCGCSTGGGPGWNQQWRAPLRAALDGLRDRAGEVFERRGRALMAGRDPWAARDAYIDVVLGARTVEDFVAGHLTVGRERDRVDALSLLEMQRHAMAMYTSCGWFFNDLAGIETVQILRYAARVMDLLSEIGEPFGDDEFMGCLVGAVSNVPDEGDGRRVWQNHVEPSRVDPGRVAAHFALLALLDGGDVPDRLAAKAVEPAGDQVATRGALALASGCVNLRHVRTGRRSAHAYAAVRLGGLEVIGAVRTVDVDHPGAADDALKRLRAAFAGGAPLTTLLRLMTDGFGPREFGLADALPDAAQRLVASAADAVAERFADTCQQLFDDHRTTLESLAALGEPLPPVLRQPAEVALARRFEAEVAAQRGALDPSAYRGAMAIINQARAAGVRISTPSTLAAGEQLLSEAVARAVEAGRAVRRRASDQVNTDVDGAVTLALRLLEVADSLELSPSLERPQELVYESLLDGGTPELQRLGAALGLAVEALGPLLR